MLQRAVLLLGSALAMVWLGAHGVLAPDLLLIVLTSIALVSGPLPGALWGVGAGWLLDLTPPGATVLGISALLYAGAAAVVGRARRVDGVPMTLLLLAVACGAGCVSFGRTVLTLADGAPVPWWSMFVRLVVTVGAGGLMVPVLVRLDRAVTPRGAR